jgi:hypothetical protein
MNASRELTPEEKAKPYSSYFYEPMAEPDPVLVAVAAPSGAHDATNGLPLSTACPDRQNGHLSERYHQLSGPSIGLHMSRLVHPRPSCLPALLLT